MAAADLAAAASAAAPDTIPLTKRGTPVVLHGLKKHPELNGCTGVIDGRAKGDRVAVTVKGADMLLLPQNLTSPTTAPSSRSRRRAPDLDAALPVARQLFEHELYDQGKYVDATMGRALATFGYAILPLAEEDATIVRHAQAAATSSFELGAAACLGVRSVERPGGTTKDLLEVPRTASDLHAASELLRREAGAALTSVSRHLGTSLGDLDGLARPASAEDDKSIFSAMRYRRAGPATTQDADADGAAGHDGEEDELGRVFARAKGLGMLTETEADQLTDAVAEGATTEVELLREWRTKLGAAAPAAPAASGGSDEHEDRGLLTLITGQSAQTLEVFCRVLGDWVRPSTGGSSDEVVVLAGATLHRATAGLVPGPRGGEVGATRHRVPPPPPGEPRTSLVYRMRGQPDASFRCAALAGRPGAVARFVEEKTTVAAFIASKNYTSVNAPVGAPASAAAEVPPPAARRRPPPPAAPVFTFGTGAVPPPSSATFVFGATPARPPPSAPCVEDSAFQALASKVLREWTRRFRLTRREEEELIEQRNRHTKPADRCRCVLSQMISLYFAYGEEQARQPFPASGSDTPVSLQQQLGKRLRADNETAVWCASLLDILDPPGLPAAASRPEFTDQDSCAPLGDSNRAPAPPPPAPNPRSPPVDPALHPAPAVTWQGRHSPVCSATACPPGK